MARTMGHAHSVWPRAYALPMGNSIYPWEIRFFPWAVSFQMTFLGVYLLIRKLKATFLHSIRQVLQIYIKF